MVIDRLGDPMAIEPVSKLEEINRNHEAMKLKLEQAFKKAKTDEVAHTPATEAFLGEGSKLAEWFESIDANSLTEEEAARLVEEQGKGDLYGFGEMDDTFARANAKINEKDVSTVLRAALDRLVIGNTIPGISDSEEGHNIIEKIKQADPEAIESALSLLADNIDGWTHQNEVVKNRGDWRFVWNDSPENYSTGKIPENLSVDEQKKWDNVANAHWSSSDEASYINSQNLANALRRTSTKARDLLVYFNSSRAEETKNTGEPLTPQSR